MDIQVETFENCRIVHLKGKVTFEYCPMLQEYLDSVFKENAPCIIIDFKEVPFIDSSGIGEVLRLFKQMKDAGGEVILRNPNRKIRDLLIMYRFDQFMKILEQSDQNANE
jgi:anti-sigma B factor antagonist